MAKGRLALLLLSMLVLCAAQKKKCFSPKELEEAGLDIFRNELDRANTEMKAVLDQKMTEITQSLSEMRSEYAVDKAKYGCILDDLKIKMASFDNSVYIDMRELPNSIHKLENQYEAMFKKFESSRDAPAVSADYENSLASLKTSILSEMKGRLADTNQRNEKFEKDRAKQLEEAETRLSAKIDSMMSRVDVKFMKFMENFAESDKKTSSGLSRKDVENSILALNSSLVTVIGSFFVRAEDKLVEMEQNRDLSFHDLDDKISDLIWPLSNEIKDSFSKLDEKIVHYEHNAVSRDEEIVAHHNMTFKSLGKLEVKLFGHCAKSKELNLTSLSSGKYFFSSIETDWYKSREFCEKYGMQLASIESDDERIALHEATPIKNNYYWLSGSDIGHIAGNFYWTTGHYVDATWWSSGQPNDFGEKKETCVELHTNTGKLIDYKCSDVDYFICEYDEQCDLFAT